MIVSIQYASKMQLRYSSQKCVGVLPSPPASHPKTMIIMPEAGFDIRAHGTDRSMHVRMIGAMPDRTIRTVQSAL